MYDLRSALVGTASRQDADDDNGTGIEVEPQSNAPIANPKAPLVASLQPTEIERLVAGEEPLEGCDHTPGHRRVETAQISLGS